MGDVALIHLVWGPLGLEPVKRFADAYLTTPPGTEHRLVVLFNGMGSTTDIEPFAEPFADIPHERVIVPRPTLDLPAYAFAAARLDVDRLCFVNSHSVPLIDGWLAALTGALDAPGVGAAGATGSYETAQSRLPWRRGRWPAFPNPHLRTNAFIIGRELMLDLHWPQVGSKSRAWELESGRHGMTRQLWARGLETVVVGRDGLAHPPADWPSSATFRAGEQRNLLVADNRTRQWDAADADERDRLSRLAWGADPAAAARAVLAQRVSRGPSRAVGP